MKFTKTAKLFISLALAVIMIASLMVPAVAYQSAFKSGAAVTEFSQTAKDKMAAMEDGDNIFALNNESGLSCLDYCKSGDAQYCPQCNDGKWGRAIKDTEWSIGGMANVGDGIIDVGYTGTSPAGALWFSRSTSGTKRIDANANVITNGKYLTLCGWEFAADFAVKGFKIYFHSNAIADDFDLLVGHLEGDIIVWEVAYCGKNVSEKAVTDVTCTNDIVYVAADFCKTMEGRFIQIATKSTDGMDTTTKAGHSGYVCTELEVYAGEVEGVNHNIVEAPASATCTEDGLAAHYECDKCGTMFSDAAGTTAITEADIEVAAALGHNFVDGECTRCGLGGGVITDEASFLAMDPAGVYSLANDITISESYASTFTGSFDGQGHTIINSVPVFAAIGGNAVIRDLVLGGKGNEAKIDATTESAAAASLASTVTNAAATNILIDKVINHTDVKNVYRTGSIIGQVNCSEKTEIHVTITNCVNYGNIDATNMVGGIIGYSQRRTLTIDNCVNYGNVTCASGVAGGIVGRFGMDKAYNSAVKVTVTDCANYGAVTGTTNVGGLAGQVLGGVLNVSDSRNFGTVDSDGKTGGIVGLVGSSDYKANVVIERCVNAADVTSTADNAAGLCGYAYGSGSDYNIKCYSCVNTGNIVGAKWVSQFAAYCNSTSTTVQNCVAAGSIGAFSGKAANLCFIGSSSKKATDFNISGNYYISTDEPAYFGFSTTANIPTAWDERIGVTIVTDDQLASGEIAHALNTNLGKNVFGQNIDKINVKASPVPLPTADQAPVYGRGEGKYSNYEYDQMSYAQVAVGQDLSVYFGVSALGESPAVTVTDAEGNDVAFAADPEETNGFVITGITPQMMSDVLYISVNEEEATEFTIRDYCLTLLEKNAANTELCDFIKAMLHYGAAAQTFAGYNAEDLADAEIASASAPTPLASTSKKWEANDEYQGNVKVTDAGMYFDYRNSLYFKTSGEGVVTYKVNDETATAATTVDGAVGGIFAELSVLDFDDVYTVEVYDNGTLVGVLTYSGLSFIYSNQSKSDARGDFAKAMLNYYNAAVATEN